MQAEWMGRAAMRPASQASAMEVEEVKQAVVPAAETGGALSEAVSVALSACKVSSNTISLSNRTNERPEGPGRGRGGCGAKSATIKRKVSAPAVRLVGTEGACETCKKAGVAAECVYGTGAACA